ncbi:hypothetical protein [Halarcobacter anaerophilus]|nr:hypothetical protein [Halarcobacter anaerophilus]
MFQKYMNERRFLNKHGELLGLKRKFLESNRSFRKRQFEKNMCRANMATIDDIKPSIKLSKLRCKCIPSYYIGVDYAAGNDNTGFTTQGEKTVSNPSSPLGSKSFWLLVEK